MCHLALFVMHPLMGNTPVGICMVRDTLICQWIPVVRL